MRTYAATNGYDIGGRGAGCAADHPVHTVVWFDVLKWSNAKSEMEGLTPVYTVSGAVNRSGSRITRRSCRISLPPAIACLRKRSGNLPPRGGNYTKDITYADSDDLNAVGWYSSNSDGAACDDLSSVRGTWPVGGKTANELGLYDMSGNVWEWCWDRNGSYRYFRGGSWNYPANSSTVSRRNFADPTRRGFNYGFRLARSSGN